MADMLQKLESRVLNLDQAMIVIQQDFNKEKENVGRLEINKEALNDRYSAMDSVIKAEF